MKIIPLNDHAWSDERGWGLRLLEAAGIGEGEVGDLHAVSVEPGAVRGNHLHPDTTEWMLVFGGGCTLAWREGNGPVEVRRVDPDAPLLAAFPPGVAHAVRGAGPGPVFLVCYADGRPETVRVPPLLEPDA